ncbi:MAG: hypothetical protein IT447_14110 [Phycisphaerales bacterium]|nr:hypothetical protein [Phycisphaerales bacterium]
MEQKSMKMGWILGLLVVLVAVAGAAEMKVTTEVDPVTRYVEVHYQVPADAPEMVTVRCTYQNKGESDWKPAAVKRYRSAAAETVIQDTGVLEKELGGGEVSEPLAVGRERTLVWRTDLQLPATHSYDLFVKVQLIDPAGKPVAQGQTALTLDLSDEVVLNESMIYKRLPMQVPDGKPGWVWRKDLPNSPPQGMLDCNERPGRLDPLAFMPKLTGYYAIFVSVPDKPNSEIELRLASDFYYQRFPGSAHTEYFWKIAKMDGEHLIASQSWRTIEKPDGINDEFRGRLRQVRFVPINEKLYAQLTRLDRYPRDKFVMAYYEIYSWAYLEDVFRNSQALEPVAAYADAKVDAIDAQLGRFGCKPNYPSVVEEPLIGDAIGDAPPGGESPSNANVGLLGLYTDCWLAVDRAGRAMDVSVFANFGAGNAYPGTPMTANFALKHPEWMSPDKQWVQYKFKPVREYVLSMYKEILDRGAKRISIDFCRYPYVIDQPQTATLFLTELRAMADQYSKNGRRVEISVRFPVPQVKGGDLFDPRPWVKKGLIDYLCPAAVVDNAAFADMKSYIELTRGSRIKCLPCIDLLSWGPVWPNGVTQWAKHLYDQGADGVYLYQADARIGGTMQFRSAIGRRDVIAHLGSRKAVEESVSDYEREQTNFGTDIYICYLEPYSTARPKIWIEGGHVEEIQYFLDGKPIAGRADAPYELGAEGWKNNLTVTAKATFEVRAKIDGKWLTRRLDAQIHPDYNN